MNSRQVVHKHRHMIINIHKNIQSVERLATDVSVGITGGLANRDVRAVQTTQALVDFVAPGELDCRVVHVRLL